MNSFFKPQLLSSERRNAPGRTAQGGAPDAPARHCCTNWLFEPGQCLRTLEQTPRCLSALEPAPSPRGPKTAVPQDFLHSSRLPRHDNVCALKQLGNDAAKGGIQYTKACTSTNLHRGNFTIQSPAEYPLRKSPLRTFDPCNAPQNNWNNAWPCA